MAITNYAGVIFDLDGVLVSTDRYHYAAWLRMAKEEGILFNETINHRLRGVSRMESLEIILEQANRAYDAEEKAALAERKNEYYKRFLENLTPSDLLPGAVTTLTALRGREVKLAIGSSSKNTPLILHQTGIDGWFDAVADGNGIANSKPDPEVFLLAASLLDLKPEQCLVVEDAEAGLQAARSGGMASAAVGDARACGLADYSLESLPQLLSYL